MPSQLHRTLNSSGSYRPSCPSHSHLISCWRLSGNSYPHRSQPEPPNLRAMSGSTLPSRAGLVRRGLTLNYLTLAYNSVEAIVSIAAGVVAGSVALVGFGVDSGIEVTASVAAQWRLRADIDATRRERVEQTTRRVIGVSFLVLAAYVLVDSLGTLWKREAPESSIAGLVILTLSVLVMPVLARAKRQVARA